MESSDGKDWLVTSDRRRSILKPSISGKAWSCTCCSSLGFEAHAGRGQTGTENIKTECCKASLRGHGVMDRFLLLGIRWQERNGSSHDEIASPSGRNQILIWPCTGECS